MPEEKVVRTALSDPTETRRSRYLAEGLCVRFPALLPMVVAGLLRLSPRSHLRRTLLPFVIRRGWAASDRGDFDLLLRAYDPEVEVRWPESGAGGAFPDLRGVYHGHDGLREIWRALHEPWQVEAQLHELIDAGQRLVVLGELVVRGKGSGIGTSSNFAQVLQFRSGRIVLDAWFNSREEALEAAGLGA